MVDTTSIRWWSFSLFLGLLIFICCPYAKARDSLQILRPKPGSVITSNSFILEAEAAVPNDSVLFVEFRANYYIAGYAGQTSNYPRLLIYAPIGSDSTPPYNLIWDISAIPDHYYRCINLSCIAHTVKGRQIRRTTRDFAIDRNPRIPSEIIESRFMGTAWDGTSWLENAQGRFVNADNRIQFESCWSSESLFFAIDVTDSNVLCTENQRREFWLADDIEIFLDANDNKSVIPDSAKYQIVLSPQGTGYMGRILAQLADKQAVSVKNYARPGGYRLRCAVAWEQLGVIPRAGQALGFCIANCDLDRTGGLVSLGTWLGLEQSFHHNASEWGRIVLVKPESPWIPVSVLTGAAILAILWIWRWRSQRTGTKNLSKITRDVLAIVESEFPSETLNLQTIARQLGRNPKYVSSVFKKEMGRRFNEYLNTFRLEKADQLLKTTNRSVAEIAFDVGYTSYEYFTKVYKKHFGHSPSEAKK